MKRREFIKLIGGTVAVWPLVARAQQPSIPVVGFLGATTPEATANQVEAFRRGLSETGFVDGHSVKIEYRWAENRYAQLPAMAADLVSRKVDVIVANGQSAAALAAKTATATIPIVFSFGADPIKVGLVPNLNRPGGNVTGATTFSIELNKKKLEILHGLVPTTAAIALLVNPDSPTADFVVQDAQEAAHALGRRLLFLRASNEREIDTAWAGIVEQGAGGLVVSPDGFFPRCMINSPLRQPAIRFRRSTKRACSPVPAASSVTAPMAWKQPVRPGFMSGKSSRGLSPPTCRSCNRPSSFS